ncbi:MAG TPA: protein kinase [Kofleriaceae bacterium]|nr:protein kinase [Kofleriaceae bacterium]
MPHEKLSASQVTQRPTRTLTIGDRVGRYLVLSALGAGGMGVVFSAYDPQLDRKVALKLLRGGVNYSAALPRSDARTRLRREAQAIAQLSHPNVVNVYDVGTTEEDDLYIAMEFVEGDTLTTWLKNYPRTWREIIDVFLQAARGLMAAHSVGLLHRDFKPDNVLVGGDGRVRVTDFGLARSLITPDEGARMRPEVGALNVDLTATGTVLGTPRYMAPEQLTGADIDARADQFSFCVALYEALWGTHPLPGATSVSMLEKHDKAMPPPDTSKIPSTVVKCVMRGLERERQKRYPGMATLVGELQPPAPRKTVKNIVTAAVGFVLVAGALAAVVTRPEEPTFVEPADKKGVQPLIDRINELDRQRRTLIAQLEKQGETTGEKIKTLQTEIREKDDKILELVKRVEEVTKTPKPPPVKLGPTQATLVTGAFEQAHGDLEGCFVEWSEREQGDADMLVRMTVGADGVAHSATTAAGPDSPMLRLCVAEAIGRVKFPVGHETLDLDVFVHWDAGILMISPRITGRRRMVPSTFDMGPR